ncbi:hypothetical protein LCGC14_1031990 [marine sediment metagenome]|uniref:Phage ABA sandwich domain-containing protein n=1 Tax=marine sediment metagenome TaxID=412755 RepID=A0A0F9MUA7_9ZZZZ
MKCPHCETEIDEHEANRCLDTWVAEAVMEWRIVGGIMEDGRGRGVELSDGNPAFPSRYSTDIAAAWEVVGRILETWLIEINTIDESLGPGMIPQITWSVTIAEEYNSGGSPIWRGDFADFVEADTAPLAICRAALKAAQ